LTRKRKRGFAFVTKKKRSADAGKQSLNGKEGPEKGKTKKAATQRGCGGEEKRKAVVGGGGVVAAGGRDVAKGGEKKSGKKKRD